MKLRRIVKLRALSHHRVGETLFKLLFLTYRRVTTQTTNPDTNQTYKEKPSDCFTSSWWILLEAETSC